MKKMGKSFDQNDFYMFTRVGGAFKLDFGNYFHNMKGFT